MNRFRLHMLLAIMVVGALCDAVLTVNIVMNFDTAGSGYDSSHPRASDSVAARSQQSGPVG